MNQTGEREEQENSHSQHQMNAGKRKRHTTSAFPKNLPRKVFSNTCAQPNQLQYFAAIRILRRKRNSAQAKQAPRMSKMLMMIIFGVVDAVPAHADWSDDATVIPRRRSTLIRRTRRRGSSPSAVLPQSAGNFSIHPVWRQYPKQRYQKASPGECQYGNRFDHITIPRYPASGWTTRAVYVVRSHSAANCRGRIPWRKYR